MNKKLELKHYIKDLTKLGDHRGEMAVISGNIDVPFEIKRLFYIWNVDNNAERGNHANKNSAFVMLCLAGSCTIEVDDGNLKSSYVLDSPNKYLFIDRLIWKTMKKFTNNCVLLVLSDSLYDKFEYIYDYNEFLEMIHGKENYGS